GAATCRSDERGEALFHSAEGHVKDHHDDEARRRAYGADVGVLSGLGLGYQLLNHDVYHRARRKREYVRQYGGYDAREGDREQCPYGLHRAGGHAEGKGAAAPRALAGQRHGYDGTFR